MSLRAAALVPPLDMVSLLLECGADAAWIREGGIKGRGYTALHYAVMQSDDRAVECAVMLLDHGADVNARDGADQTPLSYASSGNRATDSEARGLIELLVQRGGTL